MPKPSLQDELLLLEDELDVASFMALRRSVGLPEREKMQVKRALGASLCSVLALCGGEIAGMGRLVGDGAIIWYLQDVVVAPQFQGRGIGRAIVEKLLANVRECSLPGSCVSIGLMATADKEGFYEKLGFHSRPCDGQGSGMMLNLKL
ncbi:MAG: GNAT family N-acetyltransferase [Christensenellaceae bacterium]|jgi:GNAT superfamily N-acetyltransferase|nr:GNAT family N-acetyltransferase [Christensenellaceae bacterium]